MINAPTRKTGGTVQPRDAATSPIETCDTMEGLEMIASPGVELVIWRRSLPWFLCSWLDQLDPSALPDLRLLVQPADLRRAILPLLAESGMPHGSMCDLLVSDIDALVGAFSDIAHTVLVDVRLERISHNACRKFHRDCVKARLLTTYRGPATEWVQPCHAEKALRAQKRFTGPIEHLQTHEVAVFKGSCANQGRGILHRSPPVARTGLTRLLLCLNEPSDASPEPWSAAP
jgi:hypothetical protein